MMPAIHFLQDRVRLLFGISFSTTDRLRMTGDLGESGLVTLEFLLLRHSLYALGVGKKSIGFADALPEAQRNRVECKGG